jgi:hypothetical protein
LLRHCPYAPHLEIQFVISIASLDWTFEHTASAMSTNELREILRKLAGLSADERRAVLEALRKELPLHALEQEWNAPAEVILEALHRASELTKRMFRGVLGEAACKVEIIDRLSGWRDVTPPGNHPFDFQINKGRASVTIQSKLLRSQGGQPFPANKAAGLSDPTQFVVETQKTRAGKDAIGASTRPYRFGEFDILAVSMYPLTKNWKQFMFVPGRWLIPRIINPALITIYQPVPSAPNSDWTDDLEECIRRLEGGVQKTIAGAATQPRTPRSRRPPADG